MLSLHMPMYFFAGALCYLFPKTLAWLVAAYVALFCLRR